MNTSPTPIPDEARAMAKDFRGPGSIVGELFALAIQPETTPDELGDLIRTQPVIAARMLRLVNSSFWGSSDPSSNIERTVLSLGTSATPYVALVVALAQSLPKQAPCRGFAVHGWYRRAWTRAVTSYTLANSLGASFTAECFACGFLAEVGRFAMASTEPTRYSELLQATDGRLPSPFDERQAFGFDHLDVNTALFDVWRLPAFLDRVQDLAHDGEQPMTKADRELDPLIQMLRIAELTVGLFEDEDKGGALTRLEEHALQSFGLAPDIVYEHVAQLEAAVREAMRVFDGDGPASAVRESRDRRQEQRDSRSTPIPPELEHRRRLTTDPALRDALCDAPNRDAFERFLDREIQARLRGFVRRPLAVLVLSVDGFAARHRSRGEQSASRWIREASSMLVGQIRKGDLFARLGGSYFGVCMSDADPGAMENLSDRLRSAIGHAARDSDELATSISLGGACLAKANAVDDGRELLRTAVRLLKVALVQRGGGIELMRTPFRPQRAA